METMQAIHTRRSVRNYQEKAVSDDLIRSLLGAAMTAPSAGNQAPWQFVVITDRHLLDTIKDINPHASMAQRASAAILVCGDLSLEKFEGFWVQDCSAATQNLLLAAHANGLGAVWTGIYPLQDRVNGFKERFNLPEHVIPLALVVLGHTDANPTARDRFREERIHYDRY